MHLVDRLASHRTLASVPRPQLEWLVNHGHLRALEVGDVRSGANRRIAAAVGDGSAAVFSVHQYLRTV